MICRLEPESSLIASVQAAVGRSELDALSATVGELQAVVAQLQSQLTERDLQLAELRAVILGAPAERATFPMRLLGFLSEPVWVFVTGCVALASVPAHVDCNAQTEGAQANLAMIRGRC